MEIKNAIIESVRLSCGDRGFLDCWLELTYGGGTSQGFGGYVLYMPKSWKHHKIESPAGHFIFRVMKVAGVEEFDKLKGKSVRVKLENGFVTAIGHIIEDEWFCPEEDFALLNEKETT